jgi:hypothetical protein
MISKSKLGAIAFIAAIGLAPPAVAQYGTQYSPSVNGGGSAGYNHGLKYYRLKKHHHGKLRAQVKPQAAKPSGGAPAAGGGTPGAAGGAAAKQPMGRP